MAAAIEIIATPSPVRGPFGAPAREESTHNSLLSPGREQDREPWLLLLPHFALLPEQFFGLGALSHALNHQSTQTSDEQRTTHTHTHPTHTYTHPTHTARKQSLTVARDRPSDLGQWSHVDWICASRVGQLCYPPSLPLCLSPFPSPTWSFSFPPSAVSNAPNNPTWLKAFKNAAAEVEAEAAWSLCDQCWSFYPGAVDSPSARTWHASRVTCSNNYTNNNNSNENNKYTRTTENLKWSSSWWIDLPHCGQQQAATTLYTHTHIHTDSIIIRARTQKKHYTGKKKNKTEDSRRFLIFSIPEQPRQGQPSPLLPLLSAQPSLSALPLPSAFPALPAFNGFVP